MSLESFGMVGFDLGPLLQGQTRLLLILKVYNVKPTHTKCWARNLLMLDLTFSPSFKVKRWFTGFGELSFWWIEICIGSPMFRSGYICLLFWLFMHCQMPEPFENCWYFNIGP